MASLPDRVWYIAYGSNVNRQRFLRYLSGDDSHAGARDSTPPIDDRWERAPLDLRFAGTSVRWNGGGVAFVDPNPRGQALVRAWSITAEQFEDVFAQENGRQVPSPLDWAAVLAGSAVVGDRWYARIIELDLPFASTDHPALTFTWTEALASNPPHDSYRDTIAAGLADNPSLTADQIDSYLDRAAG